LSKLEIKDTTVRPRPASYLDIQLKFHSEGGVKANLYDKSDYLNFSIVNFPFICCNIPPAPEYGVYIYFS
jgi:hypothetical protein